MKKTIATLVAAVVAMTVQAALPEFSFFYSRYGHGEGRVNLLMELGDAMEWEGDATLKYGSTEATEHVKVVCHDKWDETRAVVTLQSVIKSDDGTSVPFSVTLTAGEESRTESSEMLFLASGYKHLPLVEECTGTWCGKCPRGAVALRLMDEKYGENIAGVAVHFGDVMTFGTEYQAGLKNGAPTLGLPTSFVNRTLSDVEPLYFTEYFDICGKVIGEPAIATVGMQGVYSPDWSKIEVTTEVTFDHAESGHEYRLSYLLIENNVHSPNDPNYCQNNDYSNNGNGGMYEFSDLSNPVLPDQIWYQDVARDLYSYYGIQGSLPAAITAGKKYVHEITIAIPDYIFQLPELKVYALLLDATTGEVMNVGVLKEKDVERGVTSPLYQCDFHYGQLPHDFTLIDGDMNVPFSSTGMKAGEGWRFDTAGEGSAYSTSYYSPAGASDDWMILPALTINSNQTTLKWKSRSEDGAYPDSFQVLISESGTDTGSFKLLLDVSAEAEAWTDHAIELTGYEGKKVWLAFRNNTNDGTGLFIDDILVEAVGLSGIDDIGRDLGSFAETPGCRVEYYDLNGRRVAPSASGLLIKRVVSPDGASHVQKTINP